ncbi:unnamed protein product [Linum tenue]|uniref:Uncharacterized protein n=1 Tax=Linum tenue TaxID=586396 RepID=A0AAV0KIG4_9ROSI|nr:unnamed protein product [Linum tenue]
MSRFVLSSNHLFLYGTGDGTIGVLDMGSDLNNPVSPSNNWKTVAIIPCWTMVDNNSAKSISYRELEVFGTAIGGSTLEKLRADLFDSQFLVNREGYQVMYHSRDGSKAMVLGKCSFCQLNNIFGWRRYGVKLPAITMVWNRYDRSSGEAVVDLEELGERAKRLGMAVEEQSKELGDCKSRLKEKEEILEHYKRLLEESKEAMKEKESAMNRLKEVIEDRDGEIRRLKLRLKEAGGSGDNGIGTTGGDEELKTIRDRLFAKEKQVDDFKAAVRCFFRT